MAVLRVEANELLAEGYRHRGLGHAGLVERDALVHHAARQLQQLSREHEGLVFGRLDFLNGEHCYIGRLGVRTANQEPLVIDWRAPAAEPFYRATPVARGEVVRRRHFQTRGRRVTGFSDDVLDLDALGDAELQEIILSHNLTPRKCLGFLTPLQALLKELGRDVQIRFA